MEVCLRPDMLTSAELAADEVALLVGRPAAALEGLGEEVEIFARDDFEFTGFRISPPRQGRDSHLFAP